MLVLNRKKGETLIIADNIEITIIEVQGEQVKVGIQAPREISIYRKEIYQEVIDANRIAAQNLTDIGNKIKQIELRKNDLGGV